jgi:hypothetical protein
MTILDISPEAAVRINAMFEEATRPGTAAYNAGDPLEGPFRTEHSLLAAFKTMIGLGGRISVAFDLPDLSLYGHNEYGIDYGVVWDPHTRTWSVHS